MNITEQRRLAAIMFTDMVGYSALAQRNEALALELLEEHRRIVRDILPKHGGREVKTTGDGFLIEFPSALAAVQCAIDVQASLHARNLSEPEQRQARIRIGIHVGDVVVRDGDVHGDGVNLAARIEPLAEPGGICLSRPVHDQVANKLEAQLAPLGRAELKGIEGLMEVHRVALPWQRGAPARVSSSRARGWQMAVPWASAALLAAAFFITRLSPSRDATGGRAGLAGPVLRKLEMTLPQPFTQAGAGHGIHLAISPDGRKLAYANADGLWLRWLDRAAPAVLLHAGTTVLQPFWSPQSTDIGFFDDRKIYRIPFDGGRPLLLGTAPHGPRNWLTGGAWLPGERIIFATGMSALYEVPAQGGRVSTALALADGDLDFHHASALPGGRGVLFVVHGDTVGPDTIALWTPQGQRKVLLRLPGTRVFKPVFSVAGYVLFQRSDATAGLWAFPFSLAKLERAGEPFRVSDLGNEASVADDGTLVYSLQEDIDYAPRQLVWLDRSGKTLGTLGPPLPGLNSPRLSPDGQLVVAAAGESPTKLDLWLFDVAGNRAIPFTRTEEREDAPFWSKDGRTVVHSLARGRCPSLSQTGGWNGSGATFVRRRRQRFSTRRPTSLGRPADGPWQSLLRLCVSGRQGAKDGPLAPGAPPLLLDAPFTGQQSGGVPLRGKRPI